MKVFLVSQLNNFSYNVRRESVFAGKAAAEKSAKGLTSYGLEGYVLEVPSYLPEGFVGKAAYVTWGLNSHVYGVATLEAAEALANDRFTYYSSDEVQVDLSTPKG